MTLEIERKKAETGKGMTNDSLGVLVDLDTLISAGFNYERYSFSVPKVDRKGRYFVHMPDPDSRMSDLVIIEDPKQHGAVKWKEWYVGRIAGTPIHERSDEDRMTKIRAMVCPTNWVYALDLQRKIEGEIDRSYGGAE